MCISLEFVVLLELRTMFQIGFNGICIPIAEDFAHCPQIFCVCSKHLKCPGFKADTEVSYYLLALPTMLTKSSVCIDPILYFGFNPQVFSHYDTDRLFLFQWLTHLTLSTQNTKLLQVQYKTIDKGNNK